MGKKKAERRKLQDLARREAEDEARRKVRGRSGVGGVVWRWVVVIVNRRRLPPTATDSAAAYCTAVLPDRPQSSIHHRTSPPHSLPHTTPHSPPYIPLHSPPYISPCIPPCIPPLGGGGRASSARGAHRKSEGRGDATDAQKHSGALVCPRVHSCALMCTHVHSRSHVGHVGWAGLGCATHIPSTFPMKPIR